MELAPTLEIRLPELSASGIHLFLRREDLLYPDLSGNKFRKLKYNLEAMRGQGLDCLLTFGGAYSNHIHAVAVAGKSQGFRTIGVIRGEELAGGPLNPTLSDAREAGMELVFVSREEYKMRNHGEYLRGLQARFGPCYLLPEGGTNAEAIRGCAEILRPGDESFDWVCVPVGTGGTLAGLAQAVTPGQRVRGYSALRAAGLGESLRQFVPGSHWELSGGFHFGGYARVDVRLIEFINRFHAGTGVPLDPVYTGKMLFGILEEARRGFFGPGSRILAVHTGGLQGIRGMNRQLEKKNLPLLQL